MIKQDKKSKIILARLDDDALRELQEKSQILQFESAGYRNNGYTVYYVELLPIEEKPAKDDFTSGAHYAFYELGKELGISSQDIRDSNDTIDGKAARLAERISDIHGISNP